MVVIPLQINGWRRALNKVRLSSDAPTDDGAYTVSLFAGLWNGDDSKQNTE